MNHFDENSMQEALRIANTPAGQQLMKLLQQSGGDELRHAIEKASSGDYTQAKQALSAFLDSPEAKALLKQLGR